VLKPLLVFLGAGLGGLARYGVGEVVHRWVSRSFPWGTLIVNVSGCFAMGGLMYLFAERGLLSANQRLFFMVGVLGGYTTFSSFGHEWDALLRKNGAGPAFAYAAASVALSFAAVWAGRAAARLSGI
jgi:fluoride exporter